MKYVRLLFGWLASLVGAVLLLSGPAHADTLADVMQEIAQVLNAMEGNLITRDGIEKIGRAHV